MTGQGKRTGKSDGKIGRRKRAGKWHQEVLEEENKNGSLSCNRGVSGKGEDDQKIPWEQLYSHGFQRTCEGPAQKPARN